MNQSKALFFVAGAALSMGSALAQNANLDLNRAYKAELEADAKTRTSLLAAGGAGYNNGAFQISDGSNNTLNIGGSFTTRYNVSIRDEGSVGKVDDVTLGFNIPYARLRTWGTVWSKDFEYMLQGTWSDTSSLGDSGSGGFQLEEAWGRYHLDSNWSARFGQFKPALLREVLVENEYQLAADRSVASGIFGQGYSQGFEVQYATDQFKFTVGTNDGANAANTDFNSSAESDYAFTGRVDWLAMGTDWSRFNDFTSFQNAADDELLIGAAAHWQGGGDTGSTTGGTADANILIYTVDASYESSGWNLFGAFYGAYIDNKAAGTNFNNFGAVVQGGLFLTQQIELFARWDGIFLDSDLVPSGTENNINFGTFGVNYYLSPESHAVKFTAQAGIAFEETSAIFGSSAVVPVSDSTRYGYLGETKADEVAVTLQAQVVF
ncbi:MAG: hypothetical protein GC200_05670 [Tepidisphaera sp.]|nr:hypothetical protein [Tepidisphaera sp.]